MATSGNARLHWHGQTGSRNADSEREYTAVYHVDTTDNSDGPVVVLGANGLPAFNSSYSFGNDSDPQAKLQELTPKRRDGRRDKWEVTARWSTKQSESGIDENGNPTDNPLDFRRQVRVNSQQITKPVEKAQLLTAIPNFNVNQFILPCNSAGVPFHPPREKLCSQHVIRITRNEATYPQAISETFLDAINDDDFTITSRGLGYKVFKYQARMNQIGASNKRAFDIDFWEMSYELIVDRAGWRVEIADRGLHAKAEAGDVDPDANGGIISPSDLKAGVPRIRRIKDGEGNPIPLPVFLNGQGQPLMPGAAIVYIKYTDFLELPFGQLGL